MPEEKRINNIDKPEKECIVSEWNGVLIKKTGSGRIPVVKGYYMKGTVKWFNATKGFGFIQKEDGNDLFVHKNDVNGFIDEGDTVEFEVGEGRKGPCAINVKKI